MKIEVWSDFVCPFCYIGKRRLEEALEGFPQADNVEVVFKSFELDPQAKRDTKLSIYEILAKKYGMQVTEAKRMTEGVARQAAAVGLEFNFDTNIPTNTFDAHRIAKYAETKGKQTKITEALMKAHFTDSKHIGDPVYLKELAVQNGLDGDEVEKVINGNDFEEEVRFDEKEAKEIGVQGVPFFVINRKYAISGAQPVEAFTDALKKVWEEENKTQPLKSLDFDGETSYCTDEGCE